METMRTVFDLTGGYLTWTIITASLVLIRFANKYMDYEMRNITEDF
jgi:hypothetical protein